MSIYSRPLDVLQLLRELLARLAKIISPRDVRVQGEGHQIELDRVNLLWLIKLVTSKMLGFLFCVQSMGEETVVERQQRWAALVLHPIIKRSVFSWFLGQLVATDELVDIGLQLTSRACVGLRSDVALQSLYIA